MITVKKNQKFVSEAGSNIRVINKDSHMAVIANVDARGRSIAATKRRVQLDSIRRRYSRVA